jgi:probable rRNA maturation factor
VVVTVMNHSRWALDRRQLARVARAVMRGEGCHPQSELTVVIGDDAWIQELNRTYRRRGRATDVLAFPQDAGPEGEPPALGDVAISAETAGRQAAEAGHSLAREVEILVAHGILHLTGWTDQTPARRARMMVRTEELLAGATTTR